MTAFYHLFDTPLGRFGIAWADNGILAVTFPEADDELTCKQLEKYARSKLVAANPTAEISRTIENVANLMTGEKDPLHDAELDYTGLGEFECGVYDLSRQILPGETRSYGDLARDLGDVVYSQRVGQALGRNPFSIIVPCHRIVGADGRMTGFSAPGGVETKRQLLKIEGAIEPDLLDFL